MRKRADEKSMNENEIKYTVDIYSRQWCTDKRRIEKFFINPNYIANEFLILTAIRYTTQSVN
jgi:hypothetical protein